MTKEEQAFIEFLQWVSQQEDLPLNTRRDLLKHLNQTQQVDENTAQFLVHYLQRRQQQNIKQTEWLRRRGESLHELEISATDEPTLILQESTKLIESLSQHFCNHFKIRENELATQAETNQHQNEQAQIKALKANL